MTSRLTLALALVTAPAVGQDIGARVAAAPDGTVRLSSGSASPATRAPWRSSRSF